MKCQKLITIIVLGILTGMPSTVFSRSMKDSLVMNRIFSYRNNFTPDCVDGYTTNVYLKTNINVWKRNATLWFVPHMYSIADGERYLVSESYNKLQFRDINDYQSDCQVCYSTIRHNRSTLPTVVEFMTPDIYNVYLFNDHILSPFNKRNRHFYHYRYLISIDDQIIVTFRPRVFENTQLVSGQAYIHRRTGRVVKATFKGEFDMIRFQTETTMGEEGARSLLPKECRTNVIFKFMGNQIYATYDAIYDCPVMLPDSVKDVFSLEMMESGTRSALFQSASSVPAAPRSHFCRSTRSAALKLPSAFTSPESVRYGFHNPVSQLSRFSMKLRTRSTEPMKSFPLEEPKTQYWAPP